MSDFAYALISDILAPTWTIATGTEVDGYEVTNLGNIYPHDVFMAAETTVRAVADLGAKTEVQAVIFLNTNLTPGLTLTLQANDANVWPGSDLSQTLTIPAKHIEGFSAGVWFDLVTRLPTIGDRSWRYWSPLISGNGVPVAMGMVILVHAVRRITSFQYGTAARTLDHASIRNTTKFGVSSVYEIGARDRIVSGTLRHWDKGVATTALAESARGGNRPLSICPSGVEYSAADPHSEPMWVEWIDPMQAAHFDNRGADVPVSFHELSYGLPL